VREVTLGAYAHQDVPFEKVVEALNPDRTLGRAPLFRAKIVLQNVPMQPLALSGLTLSLVNVGNETAKYDLLLTFTETEHGLSGSLEYSADLFKESTINTMIRRFETLLDSIVAQPDARLNNLEIFTEAEKRQQRLAHRAREESNIKKLKNIKPQTLNLLQGS
jgi:non-ribosomal peptide synthetase component F